MHDLDYYLRLPWTTQVELRDDDGEYFAAHIEELPGFVVAMPTKEGLDREFWVALECFLAAYLEEGREPPMPEPKAILTFTVIQGEVEESPAETVTAFGPLQAVG